MGGGWDGVQGVELARKVARDGAADAERITFLEQAHRAVMTRKQGLHALFIIGEIERAQTLVISHHAHRAERRRYCIDEELAHRVSAGRVA